MSLHSAIVPPKGVWWKPAAKQEKFWIAISFVWCLILFAMMPLWHLKGGQNPSGMRSKVDNAAWVERFDRFVADYQIGEEGGIPVVKPPPGSHVYMQGTMWSWRPVLVLEEGATYTLHLTSLDINHGFSLYPANVNFQIVPGYDYGLTITPNSSGDYKVICNEFCGIQHHIMIGKIIVEPAGGSMAAAGGAK